MRPVCNKVRVKCIIFSVLRHETIIHPELETTAQEVVVAYVDYVP